MERITLVGTSYRPLQSATPSAAAGGSALHAFPMPFSVTYFAAALATDLAYWQSAEIMWERFSVWLITSGLVAAACVTVAFALDLMFRGQRPDWIRTAGYVLAVVVSLLNVFVHSRDGYTAVVPTGLTLSAVVALTLLLTCSSGWALTSQRHTGADR